MEGFQYTREECAGLKAELLEAWTDSHGDVALLNERIPGIVMRAVAKGGRGVSPLLILSIASGILQLLMYWFKKKETGLGSPMVAAGVDGIDDVELSMLLNGKSHYEAFARR